MIRRMTDVPVFPLATWSTPSTKARIHVSPKRRNYRGAATVPITSPGYPRCGLVWSAPVNGGVVVALGPAEGGRAQWYSGQVVVLNAAGVIIRDLRVDD